MQRRRRSDATARFPHGEPRRCRPIFPFGVDQPGRNGAVTGQPDDNRDKAMVPIKPGDVALAVGRVGQAVQQHYCADGRAVGLQHV